MKPTTAEAFVTRMDGLAAAELRSFRAAYRGAEIHVFGNVAMAVAVCEMTENEAEIVHGIEMFLFVKDTHKWRIGAQTWTTEKLAGPIPEYLAAG